MTMLAFLYLVDPVWWILTIVMAIPAGIAAARVRTTFARYARVATSSRMSGAEAAQVVLRRAGLPGLRIERHRGFLTDHYDPREKVLRLSPEVFDGRSVASVAVAAHEAGHALQDAESYAPLRLRSALVPVTNFGNRLWMLPFILGVLTGVTGWIYVAIALFSAVVLFQLVTLPTEFDASRRAELALAETGVIAPGSEAEGVHRVLRAAAMTYVAAALTAIVQLLYLILLAGRRD